MHIRCEVFVPPRGSLEGVLHLYEHAPISCYGRGNDAQQPQELVPLAQLRGVGCLGDGRQC